MPKKTRIDLKLEALDERICIIEEKLDELNVDFSKNQDLCGNFDNLSNLEKVKYVAEDFGAIPDGEIIDAFLVINGEGRALLYHPGFNEDDAACINICEWSNTRKAYISLDSQRGYINMNERIAEKFEEMLSYLVK